MLRTVLEVALDAELSLLEVALAAFRRLPDAAELADESRAACSVEFRGEGDFAFEEDAADEEAARGLPFGLSSLGALLEPLPFAGAPPPLFFFLDQMVPI